MHKYGQQESVENLNIRRRRLTKKEVPWKTGPQMNPNVIVDGRKVTGKESKAG